MGRKNKEHKDEHIEHELNVFASGYLGWRHPLFNIKTFFKNIKRAWHRATKGYCDRDCWNINSFYRELMINSLEYFRTHTHTTPFSLNEDEWDNILKEIIFNLKNGREGAMPNEWEDEMHRVCKRKSQAIDHNNNCKKGDEIYLTPLIDEEDEVCKKWIDKEASNRVAEEECTHKALTMITQWWNDLWD